MGIFWVRRVGLLAGAGLVISLAACSPDSGPALTAVNRHLLGRLCTDVLALPDVTAYGERRKPFEDALVRAGVFQRLGETTVAGSGKRATRYNVSPSHVRDLRIEHRDPKSKSEVVRVCFGEAKATRIIGTYDPQRQNVPIEFAYWVHLRPWTAALPSNFRLPRDGIAHAKYSYMTSNGAYYAEWFTHSDGPDMRAVFWPFTGKPWHSGRYPSNLTWPGRKFIV
jgi:hypothetical protein